MLLWLHGRSLLVCAALLLLGTAVGTAQHAAARVPAALVCAACACTGVASLVTTAWLVFATRGRAHWRITFWSVVDMYAAHVLGNVAAGAALWHIDAAIDRAAWGGIDPQNTWRALGELALYTVYMLCGGGVVDSTPSAVEARVLLGLQLLLNTWAIIIVFAAAGATLTQHTDAPPDSAPPARPGVGRLHKA